jgi:uncharacterized protein
MKKGSSGLGLTVFWALVLSGCLSGGAPIRFYMLDADVEVVRPEGRSTLRLPETVVGLGPVHIPEYLNRPQMVLGVAENQYRLDEEHRWAERLDENISRALFRSLSDQLAGVRIIRHPWSPRQSIDYQTSLEILELHGDAMGQSRMSADWTVKQKDRILAAKRFDCSLPVSPDDIEALVLAQSRCLARMSSDIAGTLRVLILSDQTRSRKTMLD